MPHVERTRNVWRRDDDRIDERCGVAIDLRRKEPLRLPTRVVARLCFFRVVCLRNFHEQAISFQQSQQSAISFIFIRSVVRYCKAIAPLFHVAKWPTAEG